MQNDDEGKKLYDEYIKSYKAWVQYVELKIKYKQSEYLTKNNKKYYKYDYLTMYQQDNNIYNQNDSQSTESKLKYKKLSLLFHPDKFNITSSVFTFINKNKSNIKILELIDLISDNILDKTKEDIDIIINKLDNKEYINKIINSNIPNTNYWNLIKSENIIEDKYSEEYLNSTTQTPAYRYYINESEGSKLLDNSYFTQDELKEEIKKSYDNKFLEYYKNVLNSDKEILTLIEERMKYINFK